jgi:hypothetical protein
VGGSHVAAGGRVSPVALPGARVAFQKESRNLEGDKSAGPAVPLQLAGVRADLGQLCRPEPGVAC